MKNEVFHRVNGSPPVPDEIRVEVSALCHCGARHMVNLLVPKDQEPPLAVQIPCPSCMIETAS